ncbi:MAG TPA: flagellar hook assembly protein FlgD [Spirochaetales bacterium]|nr:flagellar hook assembly protein FlgD [Spirochaetales bacterium]
MDISTVIGAGELTELSRSVDLFNKTLNPRNGVKQGLDKDDFLKILIIQLTHQDPTEPMKDTEFVAQMAQFSTLEQMSNMNAEMAKVFNLISRSQALAILGKRVEITEGNLEITGIVEKVTGGEYPQLLVDGVYYDYANVKSVINE